MLDRRDFEDILADVEYGDWAIDVVSIGGWKGEDHVALRVRFMDNAKVQKGRKWYLSPHMTKSEVVLTALKAVLTAEEHEARERFRYKGKRIAGPHIDVDVLADVAGRLTNLDLRDRMEA